MMDIKSSQLMLAGAEKNIRYLEQIIELIWNDAVKSEIVFLLKKGNMRPAACRVVSVGWNKVGIKREDNGKQYMVSPFFLRWPN